MCDNYKKICVIGIYLGKLPGNFKLWLKSCEYNHTINFLLITDQKLEKLPNNVKNIESNIEELKLLFEDKLQICVKLDKAYKLCDLRPTFGTVFSEHLVGYDYWGYCDFDLIFGDIRAFCEKEHFEKYIKFLPFGHLTLIKNNDIGNNMYSMKSDYKLSYKDVFASEKNYIFDEVFLQNIIEKNNISDYDEMIFADINPQRKRFTLVENLSYNRKIYNDYLKKNKRFNYKNQVFFWESGKVFMAFEDNCEIKLKEFAYIHFQKRSMNSPKFDIANTTSFFITNKGFIEKKYIGLPSKDDIDKYNKYSGKIFESIEGIYYFFIKVKKYILKKVFKINKDRTILLKKNE